MDLHEKLQAAVMAALPKGAPEPTFESDMAPSVAWSVEGPVTGTTVLIATFGKGRDAIKVPCAITGAEADADLDQYAQNIVAAWKAAK